MKRVIRQPASRIPFVLIFLLFVAGAVIPRDVLAEAVSVSSAGVTLQDCFQQAQKISETVGISQENIRVVEAQYRNAVGSILPHIYWIKTQEFQDQSGNSSSGNNAVANSYTRSPIPQSNFQLQQPLYAGGKDWDALKIAKSLKSQAELNRAQADEQLLSDVAASFYTALSWNDQLVVLMQSHKLTDDRTKELQRFVDLGRSRQAEVLSAQTTLASLDAQIESIKQSYSDARQLLFFLTGVPPEVPLLDQRSTQAPANLDEALTRAGKRPDVLASVEALNQADLNVGYQKGGYYPSLSFLGNYYTERVGFLSDVRWDATFNLTVPLFEGLSTNAQVQQARSQQIIAQLTLGRQKREAERQVRTAFNDVTLSQSQVQAYQKAVDLANRNYDVQQKEYRLGLINNLELLQLLNDLQTVKQQAAVANASAKLNDVLLRVAMGEGL